MKKLLSFFLIVTFIFGAVASSDQKGDKCYVCDGKGEHKCWGCGGDGYYDSAGGLDNARCPSCSNGMQKCKDCRGTGKVQ
jgi:hypothetical protein